MTRADLAGETLDANLLRVLKPEEDACRRVVAAVHDANNAPFRVNVHGRIVCRGVEETKPTACTRPRTTYRRRSIAMVQCKVRTWRTCTASIRSMPLAPTRPWAA